MKSWKSSYCSVEFQSNVGATRRVEGLGASALRAAKGSACSGGSGMTARSLSGVTNMCVQSYQSLDPEFPNVWIQSFQKFRSGVSKSLDLEFPKFGSRVSRVAKEQIQSYKSPDPELLLASGVSKAWIWSFKSLDLELCFCTISRMIQGASSPKSEDPTVTVCITLEL